MKLVQMMIEYVIDVVTRILEPQKPIVTGNYLVLRDAIRRWQKPMATRLGRWISFIFLMSALIIVGPVQKLIAQCSDHPRNETALKFSNESRFEITFFVDEDEDGYVVPPKRISRSIAVQPGEHILRARATLDGQNFWVWVVNDVPPGQVCTWTVTDNPRSSATVYSRFRTAIDDDARTKKLKAEWRP